MSRGWRWLGAAFLPPLAVALALGAWVLLEWEVPYKGYEGEVLVDVPRGSGAGAVLDRLVSKGVVRHRLPIKLAYTFRRGRGSIKAGLYRFDKPMSPLGVLQKLLKGEVVLVRFTVPEGLRTDEVAGILSEAGLGSEAIFESLFSDPSMIQDLDPEAPSLEGFLFPETYTVDPTVKPQAVAEVLTGSFRRWWREEGEPLGADVHATVVLASLVEEESGVPEERPLVAGVFLNRIRIGMPLQCDPTVVFALVQDGRYTGSLSHGDMAYDHPCNTYINRGLPPSPICSPGRAALNAALRPQASEYLYFVSQNDGTHRFSRSLEEHNRAVSSYRQKVRRDGRDGS